MDVQTPNQRLAQFFFALGHTRRLRILTVLSSKPTGMTFEALELATRISGSSLTHHLRHLSFAGLVRRKVKGRNSIYRFDPTVLQRIMGTSDPKTLQRVSG